MHTANRASTEPFPAFSGFRYRLALPYEAGVSRRDPSPVLRAGGRYYVWYSRSTHDASGYHATIWYATSTDGLHWVEHGQALGRGRRGAFDERAVFTPTVMVAEDCYWLYYTAVPEPFHNAGGGPAGTATRIGVASAAHPEGPWQRAGTDPILQPSATAAHFDSHRVDESCLVRRGGEYRLVPLRGVSDRRPLSVHAAGWQRARPVRRSRTRTTLRARAVATAMIRGRWKTRRAAASHTSSSPCWPWSCSASSPSARSRSSTCSWLRWWR